MEVRTSLTGAFPRPEPLVAATRDLDRGRTSPETVEALTRGAETEIIALEARLQLAPATGGYLRWADPFRPIAEHWGGFSVGPLTRWFETNTFYRQPVLVHPPDRTPGTIAALLPAATDALGAARVKVILPGPYTLAGLSDNRSGETAEALIHRLGRLLAEEIRELRGLGYATFQFQEPLLVVRPPKGPAAESVRAAYRAIGPAAAGATTILWTFFADASMAYPLLGELGVSVVGIDLAETDPGSLPTGGAPTGLGLGCVDARTTLLEDPAELARIAREAAERLKAPSVWLGPGGPLDHLPYAPAVRKLEVLPRARALLEGGRLP
jgi:5-methyltetrahydropteroyltriglutamate--homocysteine methyltransferase